MQSVGLSDRFWRWMHGYAELRIRRLHMATWRHDRMCQVCKRWGALHGWSSNREIDDWHEGLTCAACGHETIWFMGAMLPIPAEVAGTMPDCGRMPVRLPPGRPQPSTP